MEFSNRMPKEKRFGTPKNNKMYLKRTFTDNVNPNNDCEYLTNLSHPELREMQRYGTLNVNRKEIVNAICNDNAIIINKNEDTITALVRYSSRYYIAVMDIKIKVIKTFLPDNICNLLEYVQMLINKENSMQMIPCTL